MEKLVTINSLDKALTDLLVTQMLNKDNKDFYIGNLTVGQVNDLFIEMQQDSIDVSVVFWNAFSVANSALIAQQIEEKLQKEYEESILKEYEEIKEKENKK